MLFLTIMETTIYKNIYEKQNGYFVDVFKILDRIKTGKSKELITQIRNTTNKEKRNQLKKTLPCVLFSGTFKSRLDKELIKHSGLIALDFDSMTNINEVKQKFAKDKYVFAVWISPSGNGVKVLVKIPSEPEKHKSYFFGLQDYFNSKSFDVKTSNLSRVCYESFDNDIIINLNAETFTKAKKTEPQQKQTYSIETTKLPDFETYQRLVIWINKIENYVSGNRNNYLFILASAMNRYGINKDNVLLFLLSDFNDLQKEIPNIIKSAYKNTSLFNSQSFSNPKPHLYQVNVKIANKPEGKAKIKKLFTNDLQRLSIYLDKNFQNWRWANVFANSIGKTGKQLGSFTKFDKPNAPDHIPKPM